MQQVLHRRKQMMILCGTAASLFFTGAAFAQSIPQGYPLNTATESSTAKSSDDQVQAGRVELNVPPPTTNYGPVALGANMSPSDRKTNLQDQDNLLGRHEILRGAPLQGPFEQFVERMTGREIPRYGQDLLLPASRDFATPATSTVPADYRLNIGDMVGIYLTGSVESSVEREIDTDGNIFLPGVGSIKIAGTRYADLRQVLTRAVGREFRSFDVNVTVKSLRGIRVYVTGLANNPGAFSVNSLSTLVNAVFQAGGPAAGGSFRSVKLYRNGREVADFDLYALLRDGQRLNDVVLQNEDVLFIPPAGAQIAVVGSVQQEAIYELKPGESLADALRIAGGVNVLAEQERAILYRTGDDAARGAIEVRTEELAVTPAKGGDVVNILARGTLAQPVARQSVIVRVEGEVNRPGDYYVPPNTPMQTIMEMAGGPTERAYIFGTRLERRSVREQQKVSYVEAIEQLEFALASAPLISRDSANAGRVEAELSSAKEVLELMRKREPDGRLVMHLKPEDKTLPADMLMEPNDRLVIPARPTTVGVFGAVYRPASFRVDARSVKLGDVLEQAGGLHRAADPRRMFVVRANGDVITRRRGMMKEIALPGDVVFVPLRTNGSDLWQRIKDISSVFFQLGVTAAAVNSIK